MESVSGLLIKLCCSGVNFVNFKSTNFSYKRRVGFLVTFLALSKNLYEKCALIMLMKLTSGGIKVKHVTEQMHEWQH